MDILEIKTIKDVDVDGIINELESKITSESDNAVKHENGDIIIWSGIIQDNIQVEIKKEQDLIISVELKDLGKNEEYSYKTSIQFSNKMQDWKKTDENGTIVYEKSIDSDGFVSETKPKFDENGRVIETLTVYGAVSVKPMKTEFEYFGDSNKIKRKKITKSNTITTIDFNERGLEVSSIREELEPKTNTVLYDFKEFKKYDDQDRLVEISDSRGYTKKVTYDDQDRIILKQVFKKSRESEIEETEYLENGNKQIYNIKYYSSRKREKWLEYDKSGEVIYHAERTYKLGDFVFFVDLLEPVERPIEVLLDNR